MGFHWVLLRSLVPFTLSGLLFCLHYFFSTVVVSGLDLSSGKIASVSMETSCGAVELQGLEVHAITPLRLSVGELVSDLCGVPEKNNPKSVDTPQSARTEPLTPSVFPDFVLDIQKVLYGDFGAFSVSLNHQNGVVGAEAEGDEGSVKASLNTPLGKYELAGHVELPLAIENYPLLDELISRWINTQNLSGNLVLEGRGLLKEAHADLVVSGAQVRWRNNSVPFRVVFQRQSERWQLVVEVTDSWRFDNGLLHSGSVFRISSNNNESFSLSSTILISDVGSEDKIYQFRLKGGRDSGAPTLIDVEFDGAIAGRARIASTYDTIKIDQFNLSTAGTKLKLLSPFQLRRKNEIANLEERFTLAFDSAKFGGQFDVDEFRVTNEGWALGGEVTGQAIKDGYAANGDFEIDGDYAGTLLVDSDLLFHGNSVDVQISSAGPQQILLSKPEIRFRTDGQIYDYRLDGDLFLNIVNQSVEGRFETRVGSTGQPGLLSLSSKWRVDSGGCFSIDVGSEIRSPPVLYKTSLVKPVNIAVIEPILLGCGEYVSGKIQMMSDGVIFPQWLVPRTKTELRFSETATEWRIGVSDWNSSAVGTIQYSGNSRLSGDFEVDAEIVPFGPAVPFRILGGLVDAKGAFELESDSWQFYGTAKLSEAYGKLNGGIWSGLRANLQFKVEDSGYHLQSVVPATMSQLDIGIPLTDLEGTVVYSNDFLSLDELSWSALGGIFSATKLTWPSENIAYIHFFGAELAELLALRPLAALELEGSLIGQLPVQITESGFAVDGGRIVNNEPVVIAMNQSENISAALKDSVGLEIMYEVMRSVEVSKLVVDLDISDNGEMVADAMIRGTNTDSGSPVNIEYEHRENLLDLLQSLRLGEETAKGEARKTVNY